MNKNHNESKIKEFKEIMIKTVCNSEARTLPNGITNLFGLYIRISSIGDENNMAT